MSHLVYIIVLPSRVVRRVVASVGRPDGHQTVCRRTDARGEKLPTITTAGSRNLITSRVACSAVWLLKVNDYDDDSEDDDAPCRSYS